MEFRPKFFWKWSFFDQNQQPLTSVAIFRALFILQCPYKFSSFLDFRNASNRFRLFSRDFRLFRFFFPWSACFSSLASPRNLPSWVKYYGKFASFGKEFRFTEFVAVERVTIFYILYSIFCILSTFYTVPSVSHGTNSNWDSDWIWILLYLAVQIHLEIFV